MIICTLTFLYKLKSSLNIFDNSMFRQLINIIKRYFLRITYKKENYDRVRKWISSMNGRFPIVKVPNSGIIAYQILDNGNEDTSSISEWFLSDSLFTVKEHLYTWIDTVVKEIGQPLKVVYLVPPEITAILLKENFHDAFKNHHETQGKRTLLIALGADDKMKCIQIINARGFEAIIEDAFYKNNIVEQPIDNS